MAQIAVLGAGSWGTALALSLANGGHDVLLWSNDAEQVSQMQTKRENAYYLPGIKFLNSLQVSNDLAATLKFAKLVLIVVPSHAFKSVLNQVKLFWTEQHQLIWATKGLDESGNLLHTIAEQVLGTHVAKAILSGPSFAIEVAQGLPTAVAIASPSQQYAGQLAAIFSHNLFRVYTSSDIVGAELGGAVKNVLAIATGISDGLGYGANARAALVTRGLAEMMRLGLAMSAKSETFTGLTGLGDLVLTCTDDKSRNRRFGLALGRGESLKDAEKNIGQVVEGIVTAKHVHTLATKLNVDMPITEQVYRLLQEQCSPQQAVFELLNRRLKSESGF